MRSALIARTKSTLIAAVIAGSAISGAASAGTTASRDDGFAPAVQAQYAQRYDPYDRAWRWDDRSGRWESGTGRWDDRVAAINEREARIGAWIQRGMQDGRLNGWEGRGLHRELAQIEAKERAFRSDGHLDWREANELNRDLDRLAWNVRGRLHDEDRRY